MWTKLEAKPGEAGQSCTKQGEVCPIDGILFPVTSISLSYKLSAASAAGRRLLTLLIDPTLFTEIQATQENLAKLIDV